MPHRIQVVESNVACALKRIILCILNANKKLVLNSRSEIFTKSQHQKKFLAGNYDREYERSHAQNDYVHGQQARSNVSKHQRTDIQKLNPLPDDCL